MMGGAPIIAAGMLRGRKPRKLTRKEARDIGLGLAAAIITIWVVHRLLEVLV